MEENKVYTAIGLMSGTSLDGIDIALVSTNGIDVTELLDFKSFPYGEGIKEAVRKVFNRRSPDKDTKEAEKLITQAHIDAVKDSGFQADVIGFHGQTISHDPNAKFTWQIGDSALLAIETGMDVVGDMRQADVQAGGQGAPLLPLCHRALASSIEKPTVILNLGGVGNITWLGHEDKILAFDTGPANALIDDLVQEKTGQAYDHEGRLAKAGTPNEDLIAQWLSHEYFQKAEPKSLDRNAWDVAAVYDLPLEEAVATLTQFTVRSVLKAISMVPEAPKSLYVAGGGRHNTYIMELLQAGLPSCSVQSVDVLGWNGDALEAQGFAYLAVRSLLELPLSEPNTTGVSAPMTGGRLFKAS